MGMPQSHTDDSKRWTYDDYAALPDDGKRYEVLDGELVMSPAPYIAHQFIAGRIYSRFIECARETGHYVLMAPVDVIFSKRTVLQPDVLVIDHARRAVMTERAVENGVPDLVVEVLSPSNRRHDTLAKRALYEIHGVGEYWIVDPRDQSIEVLELVGTGYVSRGVFEAGADAKSVSFPELCVSVEAVFAPF